MTSRLTQGFSASMTVLALAAGGAFAVVYVGSHNATKTRTVSPPPAPPQSRRPMSNATLARITGLNPEVCAAAGLSVDQTSALAARAALYLDQNRLQLQEMLEVEAAAKRELAQLETAARRGEGNSDQLERQRQTEAAAGSARADGVAGLLRAALGDLDEGLVRNIAMIREQRKLGLPLPYLLERRTEAEAIAIRDHLADQRIAAERGTELDEAKARFLSEHAPSRSALANLGNLAAYREAWTRGLGER